MACVYVRVALDALTVLPGKACAATSANTPVSATELAISQRLAVLNLRSAASLTVVGLCDMANGDGELPRSASKRRSGGSARLRVRRQQRAH